MNLMNLKFHRNQLDEMVCPIITQRFNSKSQLWLMKTQFRWKEENI